MSTGTGVLVAGIGNIFFGDDGFGVEVAHRLVEEELPADVDVVDYGIRGVHLAYDVLDNQPRRLVLVDAVPLGEPPGTLSLIEVDAAHGGDQIAGIVSGVDAHTMNPVAVLRTLASLGGHVDEILVVGCQPGAIEPGMGLSEPVRAAVDAAVAMVRDVVTQEPSDLGQTPPPGVANRR